MTGIPPQLSRRLIGAATLLTTVLGHELAARTMEANDAGNSSDVNVPHADRGPPARIMSGLARDLRAEEARGPT